MRYRDEKFYWTYQRGIRWPDDYIGPDSMTQWIIEKSDGFTDVGLLRISESVRAYAYLILSSQASVRSSIVANIVSANKILVSDGKFSLEKNDKVNLTAPVMKSHKTNSLEPTTITTAQGLTHAPTISHEDEKIVLILSLTGIFMIWFMLR